MTHHLLALILSTSSAMACQQYASCPTPANVERRAQAYCDAHLGPMLHAVEATDTARDRSYRLCMDLYKRRHMGDV